MLERKGYKESALSLRINIMDSSFEGKNFPDNIKSSFGAPVDTVYSNATGVCYLYTFEGSWKMHLQFTKGSVFTEQTSLDFDVYQEGSCLILCTYLGDPDSGNILEFQKSK
jgi:hypothetical protein